MIKKFSMCRKRFFLSLFLLATLSVGFAQGPSRPSAGQTSKSAFWNRVQFGGGIGLGLNNGGFNASISPSAIYRFNEKFAAGTALNFNYASFRDAKRIAYGASILSLYNPVNFIQLSAELEQLRINDRFENVLVRIEENYWSPALFLGVGYVQQNFTVGIRYNVLYNDNRSIYFSAWLPFVRVYF